MSERASDRSFELVSEYDMEVKFLRQFMSQKALQKADTALNEALAKLYNSNIAITGYE